MPPLFSSGLEACTSKCFWNDGSREKALLQMNISVYRAIRPLCFHSISFHTPLSHLRVEAFEDRRHVKEILHFSFKKEKKEKISFRVCDFVDWARKKTASTRKSTRTIRGSSFVIRHCAAVNFSSPVFSSSLLFSLREEGKKKKTW